MKKPTRPVLRWHGGKWRLAPWIVSFMPSHRCYTEVFGGGASVLMQKPRCHTEIYNDLDGELVNLFRVLRDQGDELKRAVFFTPFSRSEFELSHFPTPDPVEAARRILVRSFLGFGSNPSKPKKDGGPQRSGFRSNCQQRTTSSAVDWANWPLKMEALVQRIRGVVIENKPAMEVLARNDGPKAVHYVDPPYLASVRDKYADYRFEMTDADHVELARFLRTLKGTVLLSGYRSDLYDELFHDWPRFEMATFANGARARTESLWVSGRLAEADLFGSASMA